MILPSKVYDGLLNEIANTFKEDHSVNMICTRNPEFNEIDVCYFNNTKCSHLYNKIEPIKFVFDKSVFELKS